MISSRAFYNGMTSDVTYYLQNAHGDVVNLTSETGDKTKTYRYDAFGVEKNSDENDEIVELPEGEYVAVYNFEVADFHTYFVSDFDVLVHNDCKDIEEGWPKEKSYERAKNKALDKLGDLGVDSN